MNLASAPPQARRSRRPDPDLSRGAAPASIRSCVRGVGSALPARVVPNEELAAKVDTSDEWIVQRTGIRQRYVAGPGETTSTLAAKAAEAASISSSSRPRPPT
jgi:3-oxoacyl-[acyl-carrier-protein] synthase-3